ncbi:hypothetical protein RhiTH_011146 [Rhizoctonia solani]
MMLDCNQFGYNMAFTVQVTEEGLREYYINLPAEAIPAAQTELEPVLAPKPNTTGHPDADASSALSKKAPKAWQLPPQRFKGYMEPSLPPTTSVEYSKVSLEQVTRLLLGLLNQVKRLEQEIAEIKEAGVKTQTNIENISQTVNVVKDGLKSLQLHGPCTPKGPQPKAVEETPCPLPKAEPIGLASGAPFWSEPSRVLPSLAQPTPRRTAPPQVPSLLWND